MEFPEICVVNGKLIEMATLDELLPIAYSVARAIQVKSLQESHHDPSAALTARLAGNSLMEAVNLTKRSRVMASGSDFSQWQRSKSAGR